MDTVTRISTSLYIIPIDKTFANATDAEFLQIAQALQAGTISVSDLSNGWDIGATRTVNLNFGAQELVIYHKTGTGIKFIDGNDVNMVIGFKNCVRFSRYHNESSVDLRSNVYSTSDLKKAEQEIYSSLPSQIRSAFKSFYAYTWRGKSSAQVEKYSVNMCSPAEKEIFGTRKNSDSDEAAKLKQFDYFKISGNSIKLMGSSAYSWWMRSPASGFSDESCFVTPNGTGSATLVDTNYSVSPFGCI